MRHIKDDIIKTNVKVISMKKDMSAKVFLRLFSAFLMIYSLGYIFGGWLAVGSVRLEWMQGVSLIVAMAALLLSFVGVKKEN